MKRIVVSVVIFLVSFQFAVSNNHIMNALRDEMNRSMKELRLDGLQKPYYVEYSLDISEPHNISTSLGKLIESKPARSAVLNVTVRVGDYKFDNSNYFDIGLSFFGSGDDEESFSNRRVPVELDYNSLRRELWLATDAAYKQVAEVFSKKEASLKNKVRKDTTHDFLRVDPRKSVDTANKFTFNISKFEKTAKDLSAIFSNYPEVSVSSANIEFTPETRYFLNSEGMEYIRYEAFTGIEVMAATQAEDGMSVTDFFSAYSNNPEDLPNYDSLAKAVVRLAYNVTNSSKAPSLDEPYSGPVLFVGQAAAELTAQIFAPNLVAQREPIMEGGFTDNERFSAFQNKVGGRVLPEFLSIQAKPSLQRYNNIPLVGSLKIDDDGLQPKDVNLVENGYLRTLLSSRVPTRRIRESNGHNRGGSPMLSNIIFSASEKQVSDKELKDNLLKLVKDRELPYGLIVKRIQNQNILFTGLYRITYGGLDFPRGQGKMMVNEAYKIFPDGREELVRGAQLSGLSPQSFKDVIKVGKSNYVLNYLSPAVVSSFISGGKSYLPVSIVSFDLLFEDAELKTQEGDFTKPPFVSRPVLK